MSRGNQGGGQPVVTSDGKARGGGSSREGGLEFVNELWEVPRADVVTNVEREGPRDTAASSVPTDI